MSSSTLPRLSAKPSTKSRVLENKWGWKMAVNFLFGGYGKFYLSLKRGKEFSLLLGVSARTKDAVIPKLAFQFNNWYGGLSYDINTSPFDLATRGRGGPEFSLIYTYVKSRPLSQLKACPIF